MKRKRRRYNKKLLYPKLAITIILFVLIMSLFRVAFSRFRSTAISAADVDLAFYFVSAGDISQELKLDSILPQEDSYTYNILISNHNQNKRTETSIIYNFELKTTTNLPLDYEIIRQGNNTNLITETNVESDDDGTYFKYIKATGDEFGFEENEDHYYQIKINFPDDYNESEYQNIIEYLQLTISSRQKIN